MTTIAVFDSNPEVVTTLTRRLERAFRVIGSTNSTTVLDAIGDGDIDVLVTDILASGIDGLSLVLQARRRRPHLPVLVVSTSQDSGGATGRQVVFRYAVPGSTWACARDQDSVLEALSKQPKGPAGHQTWDTSGLVPAGGR